MMKLSIWQQFSSNHSASFSIAAVFKTIEDASKAAEIVENLLKEIDAWYKEDDERWHRILGDGARWGGDISPQEKAIADTYQIEWKLPIQWYYNPIVLVQDNLVTVSTDLQAESGAYPMDELLRKLGAEVAVDMDRIWHDDMRLGRLDISCIAPTQSIADQLLEKYKCKLTLQDEKINVILNPQPIDFPSSCFETIKAIKDLGCTDIETSVSDVEIGDYDEAYDELFED